MTVYHHVSIHRHAPGKVLTPGAFWGRCLQAGEVMIDDAKLHRSGTPFYWREHTLEDKRPAICVSRMQCVFAFSDRADAERYSALHSTGCTIHRISPVDDAAIPTRLDMLWLEGIGAPGVSRQTCMQQIENYWSGRARGTTPFWELLFGVEVIVLD